MDEGITVGTGEITPVGCVVKEISEGFIVGTQIAGVGSSLDVGSIVGTKVGTRKVTAVDK